MAVALTVAVTGASGLIGSALVQRLHADGQEVVRLVRGEPAGPDERAWDPASRHLDPAALHDVDAVVHLAGAGVADRRWTDRRKALVQGSRVDGTAAVASAVAASERTAVLLSASGAGYYGDTGDRVTDESGPKGEGFLADTCAQWEAATAAAVQAGRRVALLRTAPVLAGSGGVLGPLLPIFRAGLGAPLGSGRQFLPWISLPDQVAAIVHLLTTEVSGPVNMVAPEQVTNRTFTRTLGRVLHRPTLPVPVPGLALRGALGQRAEEMVLIGQRMSPAVLEHSGFRWQHPRLETALRAVLERPAAVTSA